MNESPGCKSVGNTNRVLSVILAAAVVLAITYKWLGTDSLGETVFSGNTQGTTYHIKIATPFITQVQKDQVQEVINKRLDRIDRSMSLYRDDSELVRFNEQKTTEPIAATTELIDVFQLARQVSEASHGAFDVTVASLISAWGFGPKKGDGSHTPSQDEITNLMQSVGYEKVEMDADALTLRKVDPNVTCNLNGIAQGYTVDKLCEDFRAMGILNFIVEVGGEVKAIGNNARGKPWQVAIEKPTTDASEIDRVIPLRNLSVSTSGNYRDYMEQNGVRLTHIIDPLTGHPITHDLASVSVFHAKCAIADAFASALMVLGSEDGLKLAEEQGLAVLFITHKVGQGFEVQASSAFEKLNENAAR